MAGTEILGGPELHRSLRGVESELSNLSTINRTAAGDLVRALAGAAPRLTGRLAGSFVAKGTRDEAIAESPLIYAPVINNGWAAHGIEPRHYAESALAAAQSSVEARYRAGVEKMLQKAEA